MGDSAMVRTRVFDFHDAGIPADSGANSGPFNKVLSGAGSMTKGTRGLDIQSGAGVGTATLFMDDKLVFDIDQLIRVEFALEFEQVAGDLSTVIMIWGMASARNTTPDSVAQHAWFRVQADADVMVETDDGTIDNDDKVSTIDLVNGELNEFAIDFSAGHVTKGPPAKSAAGKHSVLFSGGQAGFMQPLLRETQFDMSNYSGGLQPYIWVQTTAADAQSAALHLAQLRITHKLK